MVKTNKNILIYRTGQLGDTLIAMPAIYEIKRKYPDYHLVLLTDIHPDRKFLISSWDILKPTGWIDDVIFYVPAKGLWNTLKKLFFLTKKMHSVAPGYIFNLSPARNPWQIWRDRFFFQRLIGVTNYRDSGIYVKPRKDHKGFLPRVVPEWIRLLRVVGLEAENFIFRLPIPEIERERVKQILLEEQIIKKTMLLAIGPGSNRPTTKWPTERFAELGKCLLENFPSLELLVLGGKEDMEVGDKLCTGWGKRGHNLAGRLSVYGSAAAIEHCMAFVGNDTGTMHLAAMVGKPCIALFSSRNYPGEWEPYGKNNIILQYETECAGCKLEVCNEYNNKCLTQITVDDVFKAVESLLKNEHQKCETISYG